MGPPSQRRTLVLLTAVAMAALVAAAAPATNDERFTLRGLVVGVVDGDTLRLRLTNGGQERIRLIAIAAPGRGECFASQATARARVLASGKRVRVTGDRRQPIRDQSSQRLGYVSLPGGRDLALELLRGGFARTFPSVRYARKVAYERAERTAFQAKRGLWRQCFLPADLKLTLTDSPDPVVVDEPLTYTVMASNLGPGWALPLVQLELNPPATLVSATATGGWTCHVFTSFICSLADARWPARRSVTATFVVRAGAPGTLNARAFVWGDDLDDPDQTNNVMSVSTTVIPASRVMHWLRSPLGAS